MGKMSLFMSVFICILLHESQYLQVAANSRNLVMGNIDNLRKNSSVISQSKNANVVHSKNAFVTLLYGGFVLGARVLGQSLRETGTKSDLIALCTEGVSKNEKIILRSDGWMIREVRTVENPYNGLSSRGIYFKGIFTKLLIWNMTEYERIIYLDADVLVVANIEHMFDCGTFCAAYRHSDLFNAGILVVEPSASIYKDMIEKIPLITSYDDGDQGFLNVYFKNVVYASMFNWSNDMRQKKPMRMSGRLNADMGLYYAHSEWDVPANEVRIIHYTLGPIKPWKWWTLTSGLFDLSYLWQDVRKRLPNHILQQDTYRWCNPLFWAPYPILIVLSICAKFFFHHFQILCRRSFITKKFHFRTRFREILTSILPLTVLLLSYYLSFLIVPETMEPSQAEYVFWLWSNFFLVILVCIILHFYYTTEISDSSGRNLSGNKLNLFIYCFMYLFSYLLLKVVPPFVYPFDKRAVTIIIFVAVHLICAHMAGTRILRAE